MSADRAHLQAVLGGAAAALDIELPAEQRDRLLDYLALLARWNATYNLTAIRDPGQMLVQHLVDCLAIVQPMRRQLGDRPSTIADIGSGGGLPGVMLAIVRPNWRVTCVDSVGKKSAFVQQVAAELRLPNLQALHARAEAIRGRFDLIVSRAFASLDDFVGCTRQLTTSDSAWLAMKGKMPKEEIDRLPADVAVFHVEPLTVPGLDADRCLVWIRPRGDAA